MADVALRYRLSHIVLRVLSAACLIHFLLGEYSPTYYSATKPADGNMGFLLLSLLAASTFALLLYVLCEALWMRGDWHSRRKQLLIDAAFATAWFITFWGLVFWTATHTVWL